jgi:protoheme IX farnesyltransferase
MMKSTTHSSFNDWLVLCKLNITLPVTLTTFTGFVLFTGGLSAITLFVCAGVLLLASSASVINHTLERKTDALMPRTRSRPVASGRISVFSASLLALILGTVGSLLLLRTGIMPLALGLFNMLWYTIIYTRLKKMTAFAVVPGSLVGAIPPIIGWTAAGGAAFDKQIILVAFFFFIGQIPHFWLLVMRYGKDYEGAGLPSLSKLLSAKQLKNLTLIWVAATAMAAILLVVFGVFKTLPATIAVFIMVILLLFAFRKWIVVNKLHDPKSAFLVINLFYFGMMLALMGDSLIR